MPIEPDDAELLEQAITSRLLDLHTCMPAEVVSYDAAKQVADVQPVIQNAAPNLDGSVTLETRPIIPNVPVRWERAGGYYVHFPLAKGDRGWLIFNEDAIAAWRSTGQLSQPGDRTRHSIAYPFFLPGAWPNAEPLPDAPMSGEAVIIVPSGGSLRVSEAGHAAQLVALANLVKARLDAIQSAFDAHTHVVAGVTAGGASVISAVPPTLIGPLDPVAAKNLKAQAP